MHADLNHGDEPSASVPTDPAAILAASHLTLPEKRAILADWASDAHAVDSDPGLRHPPGVLAPIAIDAVLRALRRLDRMEAAHARIGAALH
ncbi:hypothetical protein [Methylobacterium sp. ID0610]|uniref:hypothetical protein n=1 Tax=Methylobacterium carpenticola TaxID=3344827 RepID=UPI0036B71E72